MKSQRFEDFTEVKVTATGADIESDEVVVVGSLIGVAKSKILEDDDGMVSVKGVFALTKKAAITPGEGTEVFWDEDPGEITTTAADGVPAGIVMETPAAGDATVLVAINEKGPGANVATVATADGSDAATTQALANALKVSHNALLVSLKNSGALKSS